MKWKYVIIGIITSLLVLIGILILTPPKITIKNSLVNVHQKYTPDYKVTRFFTNYTKKTKVKENINTKKLGQYNITFKTKAGLITFKQIRRIKVVDSQFPVIVLNGETKTYVCPNKEYEDEKATAMDNYDGDLTKKIKIKITKDKIIYSVMDSSKNKTKVIRELVEGDKTNPEITLNGNGQIIIYQGDNYKEQGAKATDNCDGDLTNDIRTEGSVDSSKIGNYTITYKIEDKSGNVSEIKREVKVIARPISSGSGRPGTIYLTFDDGPLQGTTNVILDILKEEGVKATFFVTRNGPDSLIKREHDEGHTVALHTWSHDYRTCYSSVNGYFDDLNRIANRVKNITGEDSKIIRFPGGSSNTISKNYSKGIMSTLSKEVVNRGYTYFDWNVSSGDAGATTSPNGVYSNVVNNLSKSRANIVLMHDIKTYTRDAIRNIIRYGKQNGYSFERITQNTSPYHQKINN